ncbi:MAG: caspase family protein [Proteobacteria bacterium]|nr:caspase family protein [Pseudomonadota bacterium]
MEGQSADPNNRIDLNEIIDMKFAVQNVGTGTAEKVSIKADNAQNGGMMLGVVHGDKLIRSHPQFDAMSPGKYKTLTYRYFINSEFTDKELIFNIQSSEKRGRYGFSKKKQVAINTTLKAEGAIRRVKVDDEKEVPVTIEDIPEFIVDVDRDLPKPRSKKGKGIAVVIGNSNYKKTKNVDFAINDASTIRRYLKDVFGFKEGNIFFIKNAAKSDFELYFGTAGSHKGKLFNAVRAGVSDVFVYYSGHGAPGLKDKKGYFVPVEADPHYLELQGYPADVLFRNLSKTRAKSLTVVIDACFSGANIFENISGTVEIDTALSKHSKGVILSSSRGNQASSWYNDKQHGMFTYFFLKAIHNRNGDVNKDGRLTFEEIYRFVTDNNDGVPYYARRLHGVDQTPTIEGDYKGKVFLKY